MHSLTKCLFYLFRSVEHWGYHGMYTICVSKGVHFLCADKTAVTRRSVHPTHTGQRVQSTPVCFLPRTQQHSHLFSTPTPSPSPTLQLSPPSQSNHVLLRRPADRQEGQVSPSRHPPHPVLGLLADLAAVWVSSGTCALLALALTLSTLCTTTRPLMARAFTASRDIADTLGSWPHSARATSV